MKVSFLLLCLFVAIALHAQQKLVFTNAGIGKTITIQQNDLVRLAYYGYMHQPQEAEGYVTILNDSIITVAPRKVFLHKTPAAQTLFIKDIAGFRRYSKFRPAAEVIYVFVGLGIAGTITAIVANANLSTILSFAAAAGSTIVTTGLKKAFFSSKIKNTLGNGWVMRLQTAQ